MLTFAFIAKYRGGEPTCTSGRFLAVCACVATLLLLPVTGSPFVVFLWLPANQPSECKYRSGDTWSLNNDTNDSAHYITLHYITIHYITLHYNTLHYITFNNSARFIFILPLFDMDTISSTLHDRKMSRSGPTRLSVVLVEFNTPVIWNKHFWKCASAVYTQYIVHCTRSIHLFIYMYVFWYLLECVGIDIYSVKVLYLCIFQGRKDLRRWM